MQYAVYILASQPRGTLYVGVTSDLIKRASEHRNGTIEGFTAKHRVTRLMWFETHDDISAAITREKRIKRWRRNWKIALIEEQNQLWDDLYPGLVGMTPRDLAAWDAKYPG